MAVKCCRRRLVITAIISLFAPELFVRGQLVNITIPVRELLNLASDAYYTPQDSHSAILADGTSAVADRSWGIRRANPAVTSWGELEAPTEIMELVFNGSAVYIFTSSSTPQPIPLYSLDTRHQASVPSSEHVVVGSSTPLLSLSPLEHGLHTLQLGLHHQNLIDRIIFTTVKASTFDSLAPVLHRRADSTAFPTASTSATSPGTQSTSSPDNGRKRKIATFAGAIGGTLGLLSILSLYIAISLIRRRRRARADAEQAAREEGGETCDEPVDSFGRGIQARLSEDSDPDYDLHGLGHIAPRRSPQAPSLTSPPSPISRPSSASPLPPAPPTSSDAPTRSIFAKLLGRTQSLSEAPEPEMTQRRPPSPSPPFVPRFFPPAPAPPAPPPYVPPPAPLVEAPPGYGDNTPLSSRPPPFADAVLARAPLAG